MPEQDVPKTLKNGYLTGSFYDGDHSVMDPPEIGIQIIAEGKSARIKKGTGVLVKDGVVWRALLAEKEDATIRGPAVVSITMSRDKILGHLKDARGKKLLRPYFDEALEPQLVEDAAKIVKTGFVPFLGVAAVTGVLLHLLGGDMAWSQMGGLRLAGYILLGIPFLASILMSLFFIGTFLGILPYGPHAALRMIRTGRAKRADFDQSARFVDETRQIIFSGSVPEWMKIDSREVKDAIGNTQRAASMRAVTAALPPRQKRISKTRGRSAA